MICNHENAHVIVWNDLVKPPGRLTVTWCADCGAVKRQFPGSKLIDWERPANTREISDDLDSTG